jgi:hypothetical protein
MQHAQSVRFRAGIGVCVCGFIGASPPVAICARALNKNSLNVRKYRFSEGVYIYLFFPLFVIRF